LRIDEPEELLARGAAVARDTEQQPERGAEGVLSRRANPGGGA